MSSPGTIRIISLCVSMHFSVPLKKKEKRFLSKLCSGTFVLIFTRGVFDISDHFAVL